MEKKSFMAVQGHGDVVNQIARLIVNNGFSYNQADEMFKYILEALKERPFQPYKPNNE